MALDPGATDAEMQALCVSFGAKALLSVAGTPSGSTAVTTVTGGLSLTLREGPRSSYPGLAVLKLTSGSTGLPRAARTTEDQLIADGEQIIAAMSIGPDDTQLAVIPLAHSYGLSVLAMPLLLQGTPIVLRDSFIPQQLPVDARRFGARRLPGVPFMFEYLLEHPPVSGWPPSLTQLVSAGAPLSVETVRQFRDRFGPKVHSFYGTTETGGITFDDSEEIGESTVGRPLPGVSLTLEPITDLPDAGGRVHVRSAAVSDGYVGAAAGDFTNGGFLTGDYGRIDDGRLTLLGRVSSFINVAGRKVQPEEVEAVLRSMPGVADVRVLGAADARRGQQVVACLVLAPSSPAPTPLGIRQYCSKRLAAYKVPRRVVFFDAFPLTSRGKTDREALAAAAHVQLESEV
jgi:acyl-CoA synthetase (AMP-forming)/AMP-acid ligase II